MFNLTLLTIDKLKTKYFLAAYEEYLKRLRPYAKIEVVELAADKFNNSNKRPAQLNETKRLEKYLNKQSDSFVIILDEAGQELPSMELAKFLKQKANFKIILVIAGSLGFTKEFLAKPYFKLSLSKLTLPHELARVVLLEQLYRSVTIINKKDYHY